MKYLRISSDYYKVVNKPLINGETVATIVKWKKAEIVTDHGKEYLCQIKKYDGFILRPSHTDYQPVYKHFYNKYEKVEHEFIQGDFTETINYLKHIFGNQYELGLDYLSILWRNPTQVLPILCLVSTERNTGKTTFLSFLKLIFQNNLTINTNEEFRGRFNSDWTSKLLICIDEVLLEKREDSERLKHLSTATSYKSESKGVDKTEEAFYGKFILCSNNEDSFINIDQGEIRYWVIKVNPFEFENTELLIKLKGELPAFMHYLNQRKILTPKKTRMWFTPEQIRTTALEKLLKCNQNFILREIKECLMDDFIKFDVDQLFYTSSDLVEKLKANNVRATPNLISKVIKQYLKIDSINSSYNKYHLSKCVHGDGFMLEKVMFKGRFYNFEKALIENI
ncbi:primase-helicase family protein [Thalassobellus suaedae]|uniref:DUF5906 domain-containing protein n=1 Tax=Thalassobellus suaedae TaxID=3074124 RepID=A0ABY9Y3A5_9FLAO|nr:DUF5906 domain-containing protein [Flavobacteriaceae bacterium HL-DH10]